MKKTIVLIVLLICPHIAMAGDGWDYNVNLLVGGRTLNDSRWQTYKLDSQTVGEFVFDFRKESWPLSILAGISSGNSASASALNIIQLELSVTEYDLGARKYFKVTDIFKPYISGGMASIKATAKAQCTICNSYYAASGDYAGVFINGGLMWHFSGGFNLGLDVKIFKDGKINSNANLDYSQGSINLGYAW